MGGGLLIIQSHPVPRPRPRELPYQEWRYEITRRDYLAIPSIEASANLFDTLDARRSRRTFGPLSRRDLSVLLWHTSKTRSKALSETRRWESRPVPSAGGCHPIDIIVSNWPNGSDCLLQYDTIGHALLELRVDSVAAVRALKDDVESTLGDAPGTIILHAAQFARTTSRYENGENLVWRDAGVLICAMALVAEALELSFCAVGATGEPHLSKALGSDGVVVGVGGCVIGERIQSRRESHASASESRALK